MRLVAPFLALLVWISGAAAQQATSGSAGAFRVLDKVTGEVSNMTINAGRIAEVGLLRVQLNDCRFPSANPSGDAYAAVSIFYREDTTPIFEGWLLASAPALNALDHPRYDIWVLRCNN